MNLFVYVDPLFLVSKAKKGTWTSPSEEKKQQQK